LVFGRVGREVLGVGVCICKDFHDKWSTV
jgi:hypothetical protein